MIRIKQILVCMLVLLLMAISGCSEKNDVAISDQIEPKQDEEKAIIIGDYVGTWAEGKIGWLSGGEILDILSKEGYISITYTYFEPAPFSSYYPTSVPAVIEAVFLETDVDDRCISINFDEDGLGNSGTLTLEFREGCIMSTISNVVLGEFQRSIPEGTTALFPTMNAHELMKYSIEDYYELLPEENPNEQDNIQKNDHLTTSNILAELGMSEDAFRASCINLMASEPIDELSDLLNYPANYIGKHYTYFLEYVPGGFFHVENKGMSDDGYITYRDDWLLLFDMRDDTYSPTISNGDWIKPYMIYIGVQTINGTDYLCFQMISVDKS